VVSQISWGGIIGGIVVVLLGLYLTLFGFFSGLVGDLLSKAIVEYASPEFMRWLRILGILIAVRGVYLVVTSFFAPATLVGRMLTVGGQVLSAMAIPLLVWLRDHIELLPVASIRDGGVVVRSPQGDLANMLRWSLNGVVALIILGIGIALIRLFTDSQLNIGSTPST
jgi:hypothetical protein